MHAQKNAASRLPMRRSIQPREICTLWLAAQFPAAFAAGFAAVEHFDAIGNFARLIAFTQYRNGVAARLGGQHVVGDAGARSNFQF